MTTTATDLTVDVWPGLTPRLLRPAPVPRSSPVRRVPVATSIRGSRPAARRGVRSGLLGRGGAAFPLAVKLTHRARRRAGAAAQTVVIANGEEGEPASVKDRWLLRHRPHLVLDGCAWPRRSSVPGVATSTFPTRTRPPRCESALAASPPSGHGTAAGQRGDRRPRLHRRRGDPRRCGGINGGPAKPTDKPPRAFEEGVGGCPTLVSNVETLANLPFILRHGPAERSGA